MVYLKSAEFGEKMKWRVVGFSVEEKMGLKADNYLGCVQTGKKLAELLRTEITPDPSCH